MPHLQNRLLSLDFFRGLTVASMIVVNNPGSWQYMYAPLRHAAWHGCTPTDLIFPFFLFIVGVTTVFSMDSKQDLHSTSLIYKAFKRMVILFTLGLFLSLYPKIFTSPLEAFQTVRIPGILQRIALVSFISTVVFLKFTPRFILKLLGALLLVYWGIMTLVPVPGIGAANLNKATNLGAWIDRFLLTEAHLWKAARTWDPEGILSTLPAIATGLFGLLVGSFLKRKDLGIIPKMAGLLFMGIWAMLTGLFWGIYFPLNKSLWTSSFVLYTGGIATLILATCYWIIDVKSYRQFTKPAVVYGANALVVFFFSGVLPKTLNLLKIRMATGNQMSLLPYLYKTWLVPYFSPYNASLAWSMMWLLFWMAILWPLYQPAITTHVPNYNTSMTNPAITQQHFHGNAGCIVRKGNHILAVKLRAIDKWDIPAGKPLPGEHAAITAQRETLEETGIKVKIKRLLHFIEDVQEGNLYLYEASPCDPTLPINTLLPLKTHQKQEIREAKFLPIHELHPDNFRMHLMRSSSEYTKIPNNTRGTLAASAGF
eukprot:gene66-92_t